MPNTHPPRKPPVAARNREDTQKLLVWAVGDLLGEKGFAGLGVNAVARRAGVDKVLIYRYFGGLPGLIRAFGQEGDFWPSMEELAGGDLDSFGQLSMEERLIAFGRNFISAIRRRPLTLEIMAWEMVERNGLTEELEIIREIRMLRFAEMFFPVEGVRADLMAVIAVIGAGVSYLACRSRHIRWYNGVDLENEKGWNRIEAGIEQITTALMTRA